MAGAALRASLTAALLAHAANGPFVCAVEASTALGAALAVPLEANAEPLPPAAGGAPLLDAMESAPQVVVGRIRGVRSTDAQGFRARLEVERALAGPADIGDVVRVGWEERSRRRPVRFADEDRIVVALEPVPSSSLWRARFPEPGGLRVAAGGDAFVRAPSEATLHALSVWRAAALSGSGVKLADALAQVAADAEPPLRHAALARLAKLPEADARLTDRARALLARCCIPEASADPAVCDSLLAAVARAPLPSLAGLAEQLTHSPRHEIAALRSLAAVDGLDADRVAGLIARTEPELRKLAVEQARGTALEPRVAELAVGDPAPSVRAAAATAWLRWHGAAGLPTVSRALLDDEPTVRAITARAAAALGSAAVAPLAKLARDNRGERALGPVAALSMAGPEGRAVLTELADTHPDPDVRRVIRLGLGERDDPH